MSKIQVTIVAAIQLLLAAGSVVLAVAPEWDLSEPFAAAAVPAFITFVVAVPVAIGGFVWLWLRDRGIRPRVIGPVLIAPWLLGASVLGAVYGFEEFTAEDQSSDRCGWAPTVSQEIADLMFSSGDTVERLERTDRLEAEARKGEPIPSDSVWIEDLDVTLHEGLEGRLHISGLVRNESSSPIDVVRYTGFFISPDGSRLGEFSCYNRDYNPCRVSHSFLRPGYVAELNIFVGGLSDAGAIPPGVREDTIELFLGFCRAP